MSVCEYDVCMCCIVGISSTTSPYILWFTTHATFFFLTCQGDGDSTSDNAEHNHACDNMDNGQLRLSVVCLYWFLITILLVYNWVYLWWCGTYARVISETERFVPYNRLFQLGTCSIKKGAGHNNKSSMLFRLQRKHRSYNAIVLPLIIEDQIFVSNAESEPTIACHKPGMRSTFKLSWTVTNNYSDYSAEHPWVTFKSN